jgi:membrane protein
MAAAISYYLLIAIVPLAAILTAVTKGFAQVTASSPQPMAENLSAAIKPALAAMGFGGGIFSIVVTIVIVLFGASSLFSQFVLAITRIWNEPAKRGAMYDFGRRHALGFLLLGVLAIALFASLFVGSAVAGAAQQLADIAVGAGLPPLPFDTLLSARISTDFIASFVLFVVAFSLVPARKLLARQVAPGAAVTAAAYAVGQIGLTYYLTTTSRVALAGVMGSILALLLWVYYSAMIALYGAQLTRELVLRSEARRAAADAQ